MSIFLAKNPTQRRIIHLVKARLTECPPSDNTILKFAKPWLWKKAQFMDVSQLSPGLLRRAVTKEPETLRALPEFLHVLSEMNRGLQALSSVGLPARTTFKDLPVLFKTNKKFKRQFEKALAKIPHPVGLKAQIRSMHRLVDALIRRTT